MSPANQQPPTTTSATTTTIAVTQANVMQSSKEQLKEVPEPKMISWLQAAAIALLPFPAPMHQKLKDLQAACKEHEDDQTVRHQIESTINLFIENTGIKMWNELMEQEELVENEWSLIHFLAEKLDIQWNQEKPDVEVVIREGKRYWRLMKGFNEVFRKENQKEFDFRREENQSVRLPWELFKILKNGGKRSGNVAVTKERFLGAFQAEPHHLYQAAAVWEELKKKGVLNEKDRLSHSWRVSSGIYVSLQAIEDSDTYGFTKDQVRAIVLRDGKWMKKEKFINLLCPTQNDAKKPKAAFVWEEVKNKQWHLNKIPTCQKTNLQYSSIVDALYKIVNHNEKSESQKKGVNGVDYQQFVDSDTFRMERSLKTWVDSGQVNNKKVEQNSVELWDVCLYDNLKKQHRTQNTRALEFDHIPSQAMLTGIAEQTKAHLESQEKGLAQSKAQDETYGTESRENLEGINKLKIQIDALSKELETNVSKKGSRWWTIAVPSGLHKKSMTYGKSTEKQLRSNEHPFLRDVRHYLDILETNPSPELGITNDDDYLQALSAFRYMYRCQTKDHEPIDGQYLIGLTPKLFFSDKEVLHQLDELLNQKLQNFVTRHSRTSIQLSSS